MTDPNIVHQDLSQARYWISILHGDSPGLINICSTADWSGRSFNWYTQEDQAMAYVASLDQAEGIYLRTTTLKGPLEPGLRGSDSDSLALPGLWADLDLAGPGHKTKKPLPETLEDAHRIISEAGLPEPTLWIHSGGGLYPWWIFNQPRILADPEALAQAASLSQLWQECLGAAANRLGWHYGTGVGDMARVLRLPGTLNRKLAGDPRPCVVLEQDGQMYEFDDLVALATEVAPVPEPVTYVPAAPRSTEGLLPGEDFAAQVDWSDPLLLGDTGARVHHVRGATTYWTKPGGSPRKYHATTGHDQAKDRIYLFTDEWDPFEQGRAYDKFAAYALLHHGNDFSAAAKALVTKGYGDPIKSQPKAAPLTEFAWTPPVTSDWTDVDEQAAPAIQGRESFTDTGMANRFVGQYTNRFLYVRTSEAKRASGFWRYFNGVTWTEEMADRRIDDAVESFLDCLEDEAKAMGEEDEDGVKKALVKYIRSARSYSGFAALRNQVANKLSVPPSAFDPYPHLIGLRNGVLDVKAAKVINSRPEYMITKRMNVRYDPTAVAPSTEQYLAQVIPDENYRDYVQRGIGYTLTGEQDQRAFFILHGDPGSGKSQFLELFAAMFGDYANAAADGAFRKRHGGSNGPMAELHDLRDSRFIFASENDRSVVYDSDVIKRICGNDTMSTRTLYEKKLVNWKAKGVVWLAANAFPQFPADDDAIWDRVKPIPFDQQFPQQSGRISSISDRLFQSEASGILNLMISWLRDYRERGLVEPKAVTIGAKERQDEVNPVARWFDENREIGEFVEAEERAQWMTGEVAYQHFMNWYKMNFGKTFFESRSFYTLLRKHLKYDKLDKSNSVRRIPGWRSVGSRGVLGSMGPWT